MRTRRNAVGVAVVMAAALAVAGCVQTGPAVIPTSEPSSTPVFASNAAALAAAKKAYVAYLAVSDAVSNDGGANAERLASVVTKAWLPTELKSYAAFAKTGERFSGETTFDRFQLQSREVDGDGLAVVVVYVCADVSKTRLIDSTGTDITPASRQNVYPIVATFDSGAVASPNLVFDGSIPWSGKSYCS
jgi:hypothetical protein